MLESVETFADFGPLVRLLTCGFAATLGNHSVSRSNFSAMCNKLVATAARQSIRSRPSLLFGSLLRRASKWRGRRILRIYFVVNVSALTSLFGRVYPTPSDTFVSLLHPPPLLGMLLQSTTVSVVSKISCVKPTIVVLRLSAFPLLPSLEASGVDNPLTST